MNDPDQAPSHCGFVALIGEPNAGKSTLLNQMVGTKISIVTHKVQTTRRRIRGIAIEGASQIVFVDTPGLFRPRRRLERAMVASAWAGAEDADIIVLMVEAHKGLGPGITEIIETLKAQASSRPIVLVINKIDRVRHGALLRLSEQINALYDFAATFMICASRGDGVGDLRQWLAGALPAGPWLYPADQIADMPMRQIAAEITREKLTLRLHQELPYQLTVETESWEKTRDGGVRIGQVIYVMRDGHKGIVLGNKGSTIRDIGTQARIEIAALLGCKVHLLLNVKAEPGWQDNPVRYGGMGLDFSDDS